MLVAQSDKLSTPSVRSAAARRGVGIRICSSHNSVKNHSCRGGVRAHPTCPHIRLRVHDRSYASVTSQVHSRRAFIALEASSRSPLPSGLHAIQRIHSFSVARKRPPRFRPDLRTGPPGGEAVLLEAPKAKNASRDLATTAGSSRPLELGSACIMLLANAKNLPYTPAAGMFDPPEMCRTTRGGLTQRVGRSSVDDEKPFVAGERWFSCVSPPGQCAGVRAARSSAFRRVRSPPTQPAPSPRSLGIPKAGRTILTRVNAEL
jgi:hypothetical protein